MSVDNVTVDDIVSTGDIARICGVGPSAVSNWQDRHPEFPKPFATVNNGRTKLFRKSEVVIWYRDRWLPRQETPEIYSLIRDCKS